MIIASVNYERLCKIKFLRIRLKKIKLKYIDMSCSRDLYVQILHRHSHHSVSIKVLAAIDSSGLR